MARKNVEEQETLENEEENLDDLPEDEDIDDETTTDSESLSQDEIDNFGFDEDNDEHDRAILNPPTGIWQKTSRWVYKKYVKTGDSEPSDFDETGRTIYMFTGKPDKREENGVVYEPIVTIAMSPDKRLKDGKPDHLRKLYLQAIDVYIEVKGEKPQTQRDLREFMENNSWAFRSWNASSGIAVSDILPFKKKK